MTHRRRLPRAFGIDPVGTAAASGVVRFAGGMTRHARSGRNRDRLAIDPGPAPWHQVRADLVT